MTSFTFCFKMLTFIVKPILHFVCRKKISLTAFMDDFTNQAKCDYKVIFDIHVIALVFTYYG